MGIGGISSISMASTIDAINSADLGSLKEAVGLKVLSGQLDMADAEGAGMVKMMEQSVTPYLGQNIDITV
ncbi:MAG: YjfB family protein [Lachnospiraceae bacterium]|nr:YjfB family protein [Lachnospiraceae bacterium]